MRVCTVKLVCLSSQAPFHLAAQRQRGDRCGEGGRREILHPLLPRLPRRGAALQVHVVVVTRVQHARLLIKKKPTPPFSSVDTIVS